MAAITLNSLLLLDPKPPKLKNKNLPFFEEVLLHD